MRKKRSEKHYSPQKAKAVAKKLRVKKSPRNLELKLRRDIAQRVVDVTEFLCIHGFLTELQTKLMAARVMKYLMRNKLYLVDQSFKQYRVLLPGETLLKRWKVILGPEYYDEQTRV